MDLAITPLPGGFDARVETDIARMTDAAAAAYALTEALHRHRVLVLPGQHLNHADLLAVASLVGTVDTATDRRYTVPGFPGLTVVSNIHQGGTPIGIYDGDQEEEWHADNSFKPELTAATLLYSVITAGEGGETRFADATRAYADLPSGLRARVDDLSAVHSVQHLATRQAEAADGRSSTQAGTLAHLPDVTHPIAPVHPATGARSLLFGPMVIRGITTLAEQESRALLKKLLAHTTSVPYVYTHRWEQGDLVVWDNLATLHTASPCDSSRHRRLLYCAAVR
ncbi:TauD/TfdA dioxygenase family protein [Streptomyces goshikiensis]|uniref:TauD/TfdA dioxygenase family protein n=1 Tax=Streptomyces goshikiensis TaxID=1942 RepID=UPI0036DDDB40